MPRYFFDLPAERDDLGETLAHDAAARGYALRYAAELLLDHTECNNSDKYWRIDVRREDGSHLLSVLTELLPIRRVAERQPLEQEIAQAASLDASSGRRSNYV